MCERIIKTSEMICMICVSSAKSPKYIIFKDLYFVCSTNIYEYKC